MLGSINYRCVLICFPFHNRSAAAVSSASIEGWPFVALRLFLVTLISKEFTTLVEDAALFVAGGGCWNGLTQAS